MYDSKISGNSADSGGVYNIDDFVMCNGITSGNTANWNGDGVHNLGTFEMFGGKITSNTTVAYGSVCSFGDNSM